LIIKESAENYLESILMLRKRNGFVRGIELANELGVSKPSVSVAMKQFRQEGYIIIDEDGGISLTQKGLQIAERIYERHQVIARALIALGVDEQTAYEDSCKIEHDISQQTFERIKDFLEKQQ